MPDDAEIPFLRGSAYLQIGDLESAAEALRQAVAADPDKPRAHNDLGTALLGYSARSPRANARTSASRHGNPAKRGARKRRSETHDTEWASML